MTLEKRVEEFMRGRMFPETGDTICAAFSGGADSLCLLLLLLRCRERFGYRLCAVHVNHLLRGKESDEDEQFVRRICRENGIPLRVFRCSASEAAARLGCSLEEAGRLLRQEAWRTCVRTDRTVKIAVAHHQNDQAETILFRAARGTSLGGLAGIRPVQRILPPPAEQQKVLSSMLADAAENAAGELMPETGDLRPDTWTRKPDTEPVPVMIIRPLLCVNRQEIEAWLTQQGYGWQTDRTNEEEQYVRNGIRRRVIPWLENQVNASAVSHLAELAQDAADADSFLRTEAAERAGRYLYRREKGGTSGLGIRDTLLTAEPPVMRRYILMEALCQAAGGARDLGKEQIRQAEYLFTLPAGRQTDLPCGLKAVRDAEGIRLEKAGKEKPGSGCAQIPPEPVFPAVRPEDPAGTEVRFGSWIFRFRVLDRADCPDPIPRKQYTKWLNYDRIKQHMAIRCRQPGDWLAPGADGGRKKLKDYLIDSKIPRDRRSEIPLLASGREVFWVVGGRISETARVMPDTEKVLAVTAEYDAGEDMDGADRIWRQEKTDE